MCLLSSWRVIRRIFPHASQEPFNRFLQFKVLIWKTLTDSHAVIAVTDRCHGLASPINATWTGFPIIWLVPPTGWISVCHDVIYCHSYWHVCPSFCISLSLSLFGLPLDGKRQLDILYRVIRPVLRATFQFHLYQTYFNFIFHLLGWVAPHLKAATQLMLWASSMLQSHLIPPCKVYHFAGNPDLPYWQLSNEDTCIYTSLW